jgi:hypothetical protein
MLLSQYLVPFGITEKGQIEAAAPPRLNGRYPFSYRPSPGRTAMGKMRRRNRSFARLPQRHPCWWGGPSWAPWALRLLPRFLLEFFHPFEVTLTDLMNHALGVAVVVALMTSRPARAVMP